MTPSHFTDNLFGSLVAACGWQPEHTPGCSGMADYFDLPVPPVLYRPKTPETARIVRDPSLVPLGCNAFAAVDGSAAVGQCFRTRNETIVSLITLFRTDTGTPYRMVRLDRPGTADDLDDRLRTALMFDLSSVSLAEQLMHDHARQREWSLQETSFQEDGLCLVYTHVSREDFLPLIFGRSTLRYHHIESPTRDDDGHVMHEVFAGADDIVAYALADYPAFCGDQCDGSLFVYLRRPGHADDPVPRKADRPFDTPASDQETVIRDLIRNIMSLDMKEAFDHSPGAPAVFLELLSTSLANGSPSIISRPTAELRTIFECVGDLKKTVSELWDTIALRLLFSRNPLPLVALEWEMDTTSVAEGSFRYIASIYMTFSKPDGDTISLYICTSDGADIDMLDEEDKKLLFPAERFPVIDHDTLPCALTRTQLIDLICAADAEGISRIDSPILEDITK